MDEDEGLGRDGALFALALQKFEKKLKAAAEKKSSEIIASVSEDIHLELENVMSHIITEAGKTSNLAKTKRKHAETRLQAIGERAGSMRFHGNGSPGSSSSRSGIMDEPESEQLQVSLKEELDKVKQEKMAAKQKVISLEDMYKRLQEENTSLQQYNTKFQTDLEAVREAHTPADRIQTRSRSQRDIKSLQDQLDSIRVSHDEAVKQKKLLLMEIKNLRSELRKVQDDRDCQVVQSQKLTDEILKYKESVGKSSHELDILIAETRSLMERIKLLEQEKRQKEIENQKAQSYIQTRSGKQRAHPKVSQDEVKNLRSELQQVRDDREVLQERVKMLEREMHELQ